MNINEILRKAKEHEPTSYSVLDHAKLQCDTLNKGVGALNELDGHECSKCNNRGYTYYYLDDGEIVEKECICMNTRRLLYQAKQSGLNDILTEYTFKKFKCTEDWQTEIKSRAESFCHDETAQWFYIGGQSGSGKTHLCTAIAAHYLKQGKRVMYMAWRDDAVKLKATVNEHEEYQRLMDKFKKADVLYIDDFLKVPQGNEPTSADLNLAFELLNHRLLSKSKVTIISSEFPLAQTLKFDEATIGRIYQKAKEYTVTINKDQRKNHRLR